MINETLKKSIIEEFQRTGIVPESGKWKCHTCHLIVDSNPCPNCGEVHLLKMCVLDHCECTHGILEGLEYCPICKQPVCPECGSHDVEQISRVTGYLQDVSGWNAGKQQELKDRARAKLSELQ